MDNMDRFLEKLHNRERVFGFTAYLPSHYSMADYMPKGVDFILFDCEHGPYDTDYYADYLRLCRMLNMPTVVRIADAVYHLAARAIDCGADGVLVPRVESVEQVREVLDGLRMPPIGRKGFGGKSQFYPNETVAQFNQRRLLWIQIESRKGVEILPEILRQYGNEISACMIGPCDLGISASVEVGETGGDPTEAIEQASLDVIRKMNRLCEQNGISAGCYCFDEEDAAKKIALGTNLIWMACDAFYLIRGIKQAAEAVANM